MKTRFYIVIVLAAVLAACSSTSLLPVDDVYYWPMSRVNNVRTTQGEAQVTTADSQPPTVEYLNVQDTTVTIRVKK